MAARRWGSRPRRGKGRETRWRFGRSGLQSQASSGWASARNRADSAAPIRTRMRPRRRIGPPARRQSPRQSLAAQLARCATQSKEPARNRREALAGPPGPRASAPRPVRNRAPARGPPCPRSDPRAPPCQRADPARVRVLAPSAAPLPRKSPACPWRRPNGAIRPSHSGLLMRKPVSHPAPSFRTGLILTVVVLVLLALIAVWSVLFLPTAR